MQSCATRHGSRVTACSSGCWTGPHRAPPRWATGDCPQVPLALRLPVSPTHRFHDSPAAVPGAAATLETSPLPASAPPVPASPSPRFSVPRAGRCRRRIGPVSLAIRRVVSTEPPTPASLHRGAGRRRPVRSSRSSGARRPRLALRRRRTPRSCRASPPWLHGQASEAAHPSKEPRGRR